MSFIHSLARRYGGVTYTQPSFFEGLGRAAGGTRRNQPSFLEGLSQRYTGPPNRNSFTEDMALRYCRPKEPHGHGCPDCNGYGRVVNDVAIGDYDQMKEQVCTTCMGEGRVVTWDRNYKIDR